MPIVKSMNRVSVKNLGIGTPLSFNCYNAEGILLLRQGNIISSHKQLDFLIESGLYRDQKSDEVATPSRTDNAIKPNLEQVSIQERYTQLKDRIKRLLNIYSKDAEAPAGSPESLMDRFAKTREDPSLQFASVTNGKQEYFSDGIIRLVKEIQSMCSENADATLAAIHIDNDGAYGVNHAVQRALMCELVSANHISLSEERLPIVCAALTADFGMFAVQDILCRQNAPLDQKQRLQINRHPLETSIRLYEMGIKDELWINGVLHHHERLDGSGYPFGLHGDDIEYCARMLAIADIYAAMISARAGRDKKLPKVVLREIFLERGNRVDGRIAVSFVKELGIFPPGTMVRLQNAETAVVIKRGLSAKCPMVKSILGPRGAMLDTPLLRDTANREFEIMDMIPRERSISLEWKRLWN